MDGFSKRCRACAELQQCSTKMLSLFEENLFEMFTHCTSLEVTSDDNLPSHICIECFGLLSNFNKFRQKCVNSDVYFREQIVTDLIKVERVHAIKDEENEANPQVYEPEYLHHSWAQYDSESNVQSSVEPHDIPSVNSDVLNPLDPLDGDHCGKKFDKKNPHRKEIEKSEKRLKVHDIKAENLVDFASEVEKNKKFSCPKCPQWFHLQHRLDGHIRSKHEGLKAYACPQCEKEFNKYDSYTHHLGFSHNPPLTTETKEFRCDYDGCHKVYTVMDSLKAHIRRSHLGIIPERKLICDICGLSFINGYRLKNHIYSHTGKLPFPCKICPKTFLTNQQLKEHTVTHSKIKPFECSTCGAQKSTKKQLKFHLNVHSRAISYPCKECDRVFPSYGSVSRHVRVHHRNYKPYVCPHCEKTFAKAETMKNHAMTHTGEKPFACPVCGHRFIQSAAMKTHMKTHTKKGTITT